MKRNGPGVRGWLSFAVSALVIGASVFWPWVGLAVPVLVVVAVVTNFWKPKVFCRSVCPRAGLLTGFVTPFSRFRPLPARLSSPAVRQGACGLLMVCAVGQTARLWEQWQALGWFFWAICVGTLVLAILLGVFYKPRSWCAVCPVGTLQQTLSSRPA